jgi:hypothetical protein
MIGPYALIVPNGVIQNSSDVFYILDPDTGGAATFSVKLSATGLAPVTYWGAYTMLTEDVYNALVNMTTQQFKTYIDQLAVVRGRTPVGSVTAFKSSIIVRDTVPVDDGQGGTINVPADFWQIIASLGLQRITP